MKSMLYVILFSLFVTLFIGCRGIEGPWPGGPEWEAYEKLRNPKPALYYWYKNGVSEEQKTKDWVGCGGHPNGQFVWNEAKIRQEMRIGEVYTTNIYKNKAYNRLQNKFIDCMHKKGYYDIRKSSR